jgi:hypothetical protein
MKTFVKDPDAILDYSFDWGPWLVNDTITSSTWIVESGITVVPGSELFTDTVTTLFLQDGTVDAGYEVTNRVVTAASRTDERTILIRIKQR